MFYKVISFAAIALVSMQLFAEQLPLFNGKKVIGIEFAKWGDFRWRGHLVMIDKKGEKSLAQVFPNNEYPYTNEKAYEYYLDNMADIPILPKTKLKDPNGEELRQKWIKRKQEAMSKRTQRNKDAQERLAKASSMYGRLNTLFGYKIGTVVDSSKFEERKESKPLCWRALFFKPDKPFLNFDEYVLLTTPMSHRICVVKASAPYSKQTFDLAKDALEKKFSDTLKYRENAGEYSILGINDKENIRSLGLKIEGNKLVLSLCDLKGMELARKEYEQQKDKISSDATDAL